MESRSSLRDAADRWDGRRLDRRIGEAPRMGDRAGLEEVLTPCSSPLRWRCLSSSALRYTLTV